MSDSSNEDAANLLPAAECEIRCQRFAQVTGTDSALAMMFLQNSDWDLDVALNTFFESEQASGSGATASSVKTSGPSSVPNVQRPEAGEGSAVQDPQPHRIRILSWNIDGLSTAYLKQRTLSVVNTIKSEKVEVVFLQEVVDASKIILCEKLTDYKMHCAGTGGKEGYYCAMLLHKNHTVLDTYNVTPFFSSMMGRNLLTVVCSVKDVTMTLMTSHLESTKPHAGERKRQMTTAFKAMTDAPPDHTVIFGGDLNIRDKEMEAVGVPEGVVDLWEETGRRKEAEYTWDTTRNDNLGNSWKSRLRFDRLFLRPSSPEVKVKPVYFELVGLARLPDIHCFPSDHWGILAHFDIVT